MTLAGRRVDVKLSYNSVHRKFNQLERRWGTCPREAGPSGPRLNSPGERERNGWGSICCSSVNPPTRLSHSKAFSNPFEPFQIKWEVYFSKELCRSSLLCRHYDSACICICVCIVVHGYTTLLYFRIQCLMFKPVNGISITETKSKNVKHRNFSCFYTYYWNLKSV